MTTITEDALAIALLETKAFHHTPDSPVTFRSGIKSPVYIDNRRLIHHPAQWRCVIDGMRARIAESGLRFDVIAGIAVGGIPHSSALAYALGVPSVFVRKEAKEHGLQGRIDGGAVDGRQVLLIEDMITTGGSSLSGVAALRKAGATVTDCLSITSYDLVEAQQAFGNQKVRLWPLVSFGALLSAAVARGQLDDSARAQIGQWQRNPRDWGAGQVT
ncbi:MAG: orotate phosphoribosyltransferase [Anaerolineaceae bacterium]|nr:orotate phosphoribosyltransferase [Anaerolineaceae bacterium]